MKTPLGLASSVVLTIALLPASASATAIALSDITFSNLIATPGGALTMAVGSTFAQVQNSLGESDFRDDGSPVSVTWADAQALIGGTQAETSANVPGLSVGAANAVAQGLTFGSLMLPCTGSCDDGTDVLFSVDVSGMLDVMTDALGALASTEVIFNLLISGGAIDGETLLFYNTLLSIGPSDAASTVFSTTLSTTINLAYNTEYQLLARADSESMAINNLSEVPEPGTLALVGCGLIAAARAARARSKPRL